eukprot:Gb_07942 [translate_table: standard]
MMNHDLTQIQRCVQGSAGDHSVKHVLLILATGIDNLYPFWNLMKMEAACGFPHCMCPAHQKVK